MKHILCDVDGVILHGFHTKFPNTNVWSKDLEADFGMKEADLIEAFFNKSFQDVLLGKEDLISALNEVLPTIGFSGKTDDLVKYWFEKDSKINADFMKWLEGMKDEKCIFYLATNQEHKRADYLWRDLGFYKHFKEIYYAAKIGAVKPNPDFFKYILDEIEVDPSDVLLIDDSAKNIETAKSLGLNAILFNDMDDILNHPFFE